MLRERFVTDEAVEPGEVVVARSLRHPARGQVSSPASALLAAQLERRGLGVRPADVAVLGPGTGPGASELHVVSYLDRDKGAVGLGAVIAKQDAASARVVDQVLDAWSAVLRTRRIVIAGDEPHCAGVVSALTTANELAAHSSEPVHVYGHLTDNATIAQRLRDSGLVEVRELAEIAEGGTVLFAQHGVPLAVAAEAAARGMAVVNATCPLVAAAHGEVRRFAHRGETVVLIAHPGDAAVPALVGQAPEAVRTVSCAQDVADLQVPDPGHIAVVVQPGLSRDVIAPIWTALRKRFAHPVPQHPATLCNAADDRRAQISALAAACDTVLLACAQDDPECPWISELIETGGASVHEVTRLADLRPEWIDNATIGITATLRAHPGLAGRLALALSGLGPAACAVRRLTTQQVAIPAVSDLPVTEAV